MPRTGDRNLMTMALADEQMIFFVRGAKTFALGGILAFHPSRTLSVLNEYNQVFIGFYQVTFEDSS